MATGTCSLEGMRVPSAGDTGRNTNGIVVRVQ